MQQIFLLLACMQKRLKALESGKFQTEKKLRESQLGYAKAMLKSLASKSS